MKIDISQFKIELLSKDWECKCNHCGKTHFWLTRKPINQREPLDVICPDCLAKIK